MKKILLTALSLAFCISANAQTQIGNGGFEDWENVDGGSEPINWNSFLTASGSYTWASANQMSVANEARPGSAGTKSVHIWSRSALGIIANGNVTLGRINMGSTSAGDASNNYNRTIVGDPKFSEAITEKPDSIVFWAKFSPGNSSHRARMKATIHNNNTYQDPETGSSPSYVVGIAELNYPTTSGQWVRKSVPFNYNGPATNPAYILVTFTTNEAAGGGTSSDKVWIDDVQLIYNPKPSFTVASTAICAGGMANFTNTSTNYVSSISWSFPGGSPATSTSQNPVVTYNTPGTYNVILTATNEFGSVSTTSQIVVNSVPNPTFNYSAANYCSNVNNPVPTSLSPGNFTVNNPGLVFADATTGEIDLAQSTAGTYTITKTTLGSCATSSTKTVAIFNGSDASFAYPTNTICMLGGNQTPVITEVGGTFTAEPATGLVFASATTGEIDVTNSTAGTYAVRYIVGTGCADTVITNITLTDTPIAEFSYQQSTYCLNSANAVPNFVAGGNAGIFTSESGLVINSNTGVINVGASTPGTYTVANDIAENGACAAANHTFAITINELPTVTLELTRDTVCTGSGAFLLAGGLPVGGTYTGTGIGSNIFNPAAFSLGDQIQVTYKYTNASTGCSNTATGFIVIDACLSIEEQEFENITVFPNPTNGILKVDNIQSEATYSMISLSGQIVAEGELFINSNTIDISSVQNGIYVLQIKQGSNIQNVRVVKQ